MSKEEICKKMMWRTIRKVRCSRKATRDGYCAQHHPAAEEARMTKSREAIKKRLEFDRKEDERRLLAYEMLDKVEAGTHKLVPRKKK